MQPEDCLGRRIPLLEAMVGTRASDTVNGSFVRTPSPGLTADASVWARELAIPIGVEGIELKLDTGGRSDLSARVMLRT